MSVEVPPEPTPKAPGCGFFVGYLMVLMFGGQMAFRAGGPQVLVGSLAFLWLAAAGYLAKHKAFGRVLIAGAVAVFVHGSVIRTNDPEYKAKAEARRVAHEAKKAKEREEVYQAAEDRRFAAAVMRFDAQVVAEEFEAGSDAALAKYKGKLVVITGRVSEVVIEGELPRLSVLGVNNGEITKAGVLFRSPKGELLSDIKVGDDVEALGEISAFLLGVPAAVLQEVRKRQ